MNHSHSLSAAQISEIIAMAWCDKTPFSAITNCTCLREKDVIALMRRSLKPSSYRLWRKRVHARKAKHIRVKKPTDRKMVAL